MSVERLERAQRLLLELFEINNAIKSSEKSLDDLPKEASASDRFGPMFAFELRVRWARRYQEMILEVLNGIVCEEFGKAANEDMKRRMKNVRRRKMRRKAADI